MTSVTASACLRLRARRNSHRPAAPTRTPAREPPTAAPIVVPWFWSVAGWDAAVELVEVVEDIELVLTVTGVGVALLFSIRVVELEMIDVGVALIFAFRVVETGDEEVEVVDVVEAASPIVVNMDGSAVAPGWLDRMNNFRTKTIDGNPLIRSTGIYEAERRRRLHLQLKSKTFSSVVQLYDWPSMQ